MSGDRSRRTPSGRTLRLVSEGTADELADATADGPPASADAGPEPDDRLVLPCERRSVAVGRHWVVRSVAQRGVVAMANQVVELLSSELLANAVLHGSEGGPVTIEVLHTPASVRVAVTDGSDGSPVVLHREPSAPDGRGMAIVEAMSSRWGVVERAGGGKTVWFELDLDDF